MSRRARAVAFLLLALAAAAAAAAIAEGYGSSVARGYGALRAVVVVESALPAGTRLGSPRAGDALTVRRVPERFVPPGSLASPDEAAGMTAAGELAAGAYLQAALLHPPGARPMGRPSLGRGRGPVEIAVSGSDALLLGGARPEGSKMDVIVTTEPAGAGPGRTYVAARGVPLLALRPGLEGTEPGSTSVATLGLTRRQALRLIAAESIARRVTLLPAGRR
ncbi:MAG TPA: SAF domain-containing protein [Solirubrobacterales bacterium]